MKKKVLLLVMSLSILFVVGGCAKKGDNEDLSTQPDTNTTTTEDATDTTDTEDTTGTEDAVSELPKVEAYVASEYITLGQYKGVEVTVQQLEVTDEDIDTAIEQDMAANATQEEVTGRPVQDGDIVNIDFEGLLDGEAFEGGTSTGYDLVIGSGSFIEGFEEGLIGAEIGEKLSLDLTFPEDYGSAELAGKAVVFNVTVNSIKKSVTPELTESYVTENTDYETIEAYREGIRADLTAANQETMDGEKATNIMTTILDSSTIIKLPQTLVDYYTAQIKNSFMQQAANYGMDIETYVSANSMTMEQYDDYVNDMVEAYSQRDLLINAVAQAEALEATQEEIDAAVTEYMGYYQVTTKEELFASVSEDEIKNSVLMQKAYDFIIDNAVVTTVAAE